MYFIIIEIYKALLYEYKKKNSINIEDELAVAMAAEIAKEIDNEILNGLKGLNGTKSIRDMRVNRIR